MAGLSRLLTIAGAQALLGGLLLPVGASDVPDPARVVAALEALQVASEPALHLRVHCADRERVRSFELFPSGVGIWDHRAQFTLPPEQRRSLAARLLESDFASFAPSYGGREGSQDGEAALRVVCRVDLEAAGPDGNPLHEAPLHKASVQLDEGEQSAELAALAAELLDLVEPFGREGTRAVDLEDGLRKLTAGELAPEAFGLRFVELPAQPGRFGTILRVEGRTLSRQRYAPGREVGEPTSRDLDSAELRTLFAALVEARPWELPVNLWADDQREVEVRVLGERQSVIARSFARLEEQRGSDEQKRFDRLVDRLGALRDSDDSP